MLTVQFANYSEALKHRANHGGWIFLTDQAEAYWFSLEFTPTKIFLHHSLKGKNGGLY
jgi:hypothetical protein